MSSLKKNLFLSVFGAAMSASVAFAADLPAPPVIEYEPETAIEIGSGWYLRGDVGAAVYKGGDASWVDASGGKIEFWDESIDESWLVGIGAGYYFNEYFRADLTLDYRGKAKYKGTAPCGASCTSIERVSFSAWTLMANGYYDFGTWSSITPYVGAGLGVAYLNVGDYKTSATGTNTFSNHGQANFAWNVMAGASMEVAHNVKLDANYRYTSLGKSRTGRASDGQNPVKFKDLYAHDFRLGLRYDLN